MKLKKLLAALALLLTAPLASADIVSYTFLANGQTEGVAQQGSAVFSFDTNNLGWLQITLTDNVSPTAKTASELDGLLFSFSDPLGALTLQSVSPQAVLDCSGDHAIPCDPYAGVAPALYGWGAQSSGDDASLGAGFTGSGYAYHPYAVINSNYALPATGDGNLANGSHNPFLVGPVTFTFQTDLASIPDVTSVQFLFGTNPDSQSGTCTSDQCGDVGPCTDGLCASVPEPNTLALIGVALSAFGWGARRKLYNA